MAAAGGMAARLDMTTMTDILAADISISPSNARVCAVTGIGNAPDITATERSNGKRVCTNRKRWRIADDTDAYAASGRSRVLDKAPVELRRERY
jgi:hypothetical protein